MTTLKQIDANIKSIQNRYETVREKVQETALAIIEHAKDHGDCTRAVKLCRALPARERNSLIGWFSLYSPIGVRMGKTTKEDNCRFIKEDSKRYNIFNLDGAKANKWYDDPANENAAPKPLNTLDDFFKSMYANLDRVQKQMDEKFIEGDRESVNEAITKIRESLADIQTNGEGEIDFGQNNEPNIPVMAA